MRVGQRVTIELVETDAGKRVYYIRSGGLCEICTDPERVSDAASDVIRRYRDYLIDTERTP